MTGRYHLTTIYTDSSRPNTPKHAKFSPPAAGIAENFPINSIINFRPHRQGQATARQHTMLSGGTGGAPSCRDATARAGTTLSAGLLVPCAVRMGMPNAMPRSPGAGASNAQRQYPPPNAASRSQYPVALIKCSSCLQLAAIYNTRDTLHNLTDLARSR
jgi:hypothetical protein